MFIIFLYTEHNSFTAHSSIISRIVHGRMQIDDVNIHGAANQLTHG